MALFELLGLTGCTGDDGPPNGGDVVFLDVAAEVVPTMPTVLAVTWRTETERAGVVVFSVVGEGEHATTEVAVGKDHRALLVGLPENVEVEWRIVDGDVETEPQQTTTGSLPVDLPVLAVEGGGNDQFTFTALLDEGRNRVVVLDPKGRPTWVHDDTRGLSVFRVRPMVDGEGVVFLSSIVRGGPSPDSELVRIGWDGVERESVPVPDLGHDFAELPDGSVVALAYEQRGDVLGNALLRIPAGGGVVESIWDSWDCFDPVLFPGDDPQQGWTHANAMDYDADRDVFLVGLRNLDAITEVDPATRSCNWTLGGPAGDVEITGQERFHHSHQFARTENGILVFDNDGAPGSVSRVLEFTLDPAAKTAEVVGTLVADPPLFSFILGDVKPLGDERMVVWSAAGTLDRYDADGERIFRVTTPENTLYGFAWWTTDPTRP